MGKTILAAAAVAEERVRTLFRDGIFWLSVGRGGDRRLHPLLTSVARELHALLSPRYGARALPAMDSSDAAAQWIASTVRERALRCLLVLDDVWEPEVAVRT